MLHQGSKKACKINPLDLQLVSDFNQFKTNLNHMTSWFNSLPNDKILNQSNSKDFADDKIEVTEKLDFVLGRVEKIVRKCWLPAFSPFPTLFSKGCFLRVVKSRDCVVKS